MIAPATARTGSMVLSTTVDHLTALPASLPTGREPVTVGRLVTPAPVVRPDTPAPAVDELFRSDALLTSVVVRAGAELLLLSRDRFEFHMTGRLGFGRAVYARRSIETMLPASTLRLDAGTDLAAASAAVLGRPEVQRYDDVVVVDGADDGDALTVGVVPVSALLEALARQFAFRSLHDPLTSLPNRLLLAQHCRALGEAAGGGSRAVLLYIDLDHFKPVNDEYGHAAGDAVLVEFARRLEAIADGCGVAARLGGDEFAILLAGVSQEQAVALADRVVLAADSPFFVGDRVISVGASVGMAVPPAAGFDPVAEVPGARQELAHDTVEVLLRHADAAMYRAKQGGRNRVVVAHEPDRHRELQRRVRIGERLRQMMDSASEGEYLSLHFQPKLRLADRRQVEVEALLRWRDPDLGTVPPGEFIPVAEAEGLIGRLSRWVLAAACRQAAAWPVTDVPRIAVNISPLHLAEADFCRQVRGILADSGLDPERLCVEITETAAVSDLALATTRLAELRSMGVTVALDDFGTGASSLTLLRHLPFDVVKIDREFIADVDIEPADAVLVRLIVEAAHSLGRTVCAEGVERPGQLAQLLAIGCDTAQGFYLGMPVSAHEIDPASAVGGGGDLAGSRPLLAPGQELIAVTDAAGSVVYCSAAVVDVLGYQPADVVGTAVADHLHPDDRAAIGQRGADHRLPLRVRRSDGSYVWLESDVRAIGAEGEPGKSLITVRDVTELVRSQDRLRETERRYDAQFRRAPLPVGTWVRRNGTWRLMDANRAAEEATDGRVREVLGLDAATVWPEMPELLDALERSCERQEVLVHLCEYRSYSGRRSAPARMHFVPVAPDTVLVHCEVLTPAEA